MLVLSLFLSQAEAKKPPQAEPVNPVPSANFYLRDTPDKDPSVYLGRFVFDDFPNEASARKTECSKYMDIREISGGNVESDYVMNASSALTVGLKVPGMSFANNTGGYEGGTGVRATYTTTKKMVADISDPEAFDACCLKKAGNCSEYYISEFIEGSGKLWRAHSQFAGIKVTGKLQQALPAEVQASGEYNWVAARDFPTPVYFAFKTTKVPDLCKELVDNPPKVENGMYFTGKSTQRPDEPNANKHAEINARQSLVRYIATEMVSTDIVQKTYGKDGDALVEDTEFIESKSAGIMKKVQTARFCPVEEVRTVDNGAQYISRVLMFISNDDLQQLSQELFPTAQ